MVYRFDDDGHGEVYSEQCNAELEPYLGNRYPASDIPQIARRLYERNRVRVLSDVHYTPVPLTPRLSPLTGNDLDMSLCFLRSSSPIHVQYLKNMGVAATLVVSLVGYWVLVRWVPVPGAGMPGHDIHFLDPDLNIVNWLDQHIMPGHLLEDEVTHNLRDPEGLLSDIPALGTALLGLLTGMWLRGNRTLKEKNLGLAAASVACLASGYLWSVWFPLNKKMWTSTFVLVAAGWSLAVLTLAYLVVEQWGWGKGRSRGWVYPWLVLGSNAIVAYMFSELLSDGLWNLEFTSGQGRTSVLGYVTDHIYAQIPGNFSPTGSQADRFSDDAPAGDARPDRGL